MKYLLNVLIIAGISLDIFAAMEIEGAGFAEVKKKTLVAVSSLVALIQLVCYFGGYAAGYYLDRQNVFEDTQWLGDVLATIILFLLGIRLVIKAIHREFIHEVRREPDIKRIVLIIIVLSLYTIAAGVACGLLSVNALSMFIIIVICSVIVVLTGIYTGMHYGFEGKTFAYIAGALLLFIAGGEVLLENVLGVIS